MSRRAGAPRCSPVPRRCCSGSSCTSSGSRAGRRDAVRALRRARRVAGDALGLGARDARARAGRARGAAGHRGHRPARHRRERAVRARERAWLSLDRLGARLALPGGDDPRRHLSCTSASVASSAPASPSRSSASDWWPRDESDRLVELVRGGLVDEIHRGDLAVVAADGELRFRVGHPRDRVAFWRSSAKPFQAMPLIASGAAARLGLEPEDVALMAASHGGEPVHVERVRSLLARTGHRPGELRVRRPRAARRHVGARARSGGASSRARCTTTARASTPACSPSRISSARQARDTGRRAIRCRSRWRRTSPASPGCAPMTSRSVSTAAACPVSASPCTAWRSRSHG